MTSFEKSLMKEKLQIVKWSISDAKSDKNLPFVNLYKEYYDKMKSATSMEEFDSIELQLWYAESNLHKSVKK